MTLKDRVTELEAQNKLLTDQGKLLIQTIKNLAQTLENVKVIFETLNKDVFMGSSFILRLMHEHYDKEEIDKMVSITEERFKDNKKFEKIIDGGFNLQKET